MKCTGCGMKETLDCQVFERGGDLSCARCGKKATAEQIKKLKRLGR